MHINFTTKKIINLTFLLLGMVIGSLFWLELHFYGNKVTKRFNGLIADLREGLTHLNYKNQQWAGIETRYSNQQSTFHLIHQIKEKQMFNMYQFQQMRWLIENMSVINTLTYRQNLLTIGGIVYSIDELNKLFADPYFKLYFSNHSIKKIIQTSQKLQFILSGKWVYVHK